jgi:mannonate dehydratase
VKITFRWYGENDRITLGKIRQIPVVTGVVTALYDTPVGGVWPEESIARLTGVCRENGLECEVVESLPVHEDIKLGLPSAAGYIENYKENIRRLGKYGVKCVCYNFMPVFDWLRSDLNYALSDGSSALSYKRKDILRLNPDRSKLSLPGWDESYTRDGLRALLARYENVDGERLWDNLGAFLSEIIPVAEASGVKMAIHPDDPPWSVFGLPRIITGAESVRRLLRLAPGEANGITFCTGSFGATGANGLLSRRENVKRRNGSRGGAITDGLKEIADAAKGRVHFLHLRNIEITGEHDFHETAHPSECGGIDMYAVLKKLLDDGFDGYVRPDHGRMIWGENGRPGYGLFDRALGACYIAGLYEAYVKERAADAGKKRDKFGVRRNVNKLINNV